MTMPGEVVLNRLTDKPIPFSSGRLAPGVGDRQ
jgi:hypothetical protein